jgi:ferredoxin-NADP reductase
VPTVGRVRAWQHGPMAPPEARPTNDVASFERRLRRSAQALAEGTTEPDLGRLLAHVGQRRARRTPDHLLGPGADPAPPTTPTAATTVPTSATEGPAAPPPDAERAVRTGAPGEVLEVEQVGSSVRIFRVGRPPGLQFTAGQYLKAGTSARRGSFSIASAPHEAHVELCIELIPGGRLTPELFSLRPGDRLEVGDQAKGSFVLDTSGQTHLMVATVTGLAPMRSMLRDALHRGSTDRFIVLHGASYAHELPYHDEMVALAAADQRVEYVPTVSRPTEATNAGWSGRSGRVDPLAAEVAATLDRATTRVYACGNTGMVKNVSSQLKALGFTVHSETFD